MPAQKDEMQLFNPNYYNQVKFIDPVTKKKINKHLHDINDRITDEDIMNVKTDLAGIAASFVEVRERKLQPE